MLAGPIVESLGWRWLFWIPMIVVSLSTVLVRRYVPESPNRVPGRIDWLAAALLSGWLVALLLPLSAGRSWGWGSSLTIGLFAAAVVLLAGWITVELRSRNPLIDMRMMRLPAVWTTNLVALLFGAAMFAVYAFLPQFMQTPTVGRLRVRLECHAGRAADAADAGHDGRRPVRSAGRSRRGSA